MFPHIRPLLHNPPFLHDDNVFCKLPRKRNIVGNEQERGIRTRRKTLQVVRDHLPDGGIEPLRRLIRKDPLRLAHIRHCAQDTLQHPARQLVRVRSEDARRIVEAEPCEEFLILRCRPRAPSRTTPHIRHLTCNTVHGAECRARQLGNNAPTFAPVSGAQLLSTECSHIHTVIEYPSRSLGICGQCTEEHLTERGLPAAALSDDGRHAACGESDADTIERGRGSSTALIAHSQIMDNKAFLLHHRHPRTSCRTSKRRRSSCPVMLSELTRSTIAAPGTMMRCGACR